MKCRTCLTVMNPNNGTHFKKKLHLGKTIEEIILLFIPEMVKSNLVGDYICSNCANSVQVFATFIKKVLSVEKFLKDKNRYQKEPTGVVPAPVEEVITSTVNSSAEEEIQVQKPATFFKPFRTYPGKNGTPVSPVREQSVVQSKPCLVVTNIQNLIDQTKKSTEECQEAINYANKFLKPLATTSNSNRKEICSNNTEKFVNLSPNVESVTNLKVPENILNVIADCLKTTEVDPVLQNDVDVEYPELSEERPCLDKILTGTELIRTFNPSTITYNFTVDHNRVIGITKTNEETADIFNKLSKSNITLFGQDKLKDASTKRILLLGSSFFLCPECKIPYSGYLPLKVHFADAHPDLVCPPKDFKNKFSDVITYSSLANTLQKVCPVCDKRFGSYRMLESHIKHTHEDFYLYSCKECGKQFKKKGRYTEHVKNYETYHNCRVRHCSICKEVVASDSFKGHIDAHRTFKCTKCKMKFLSAKSLNNHQLVHQRIAIKKSWAKPQLCMICGKLIIGGSNMTHHLKRHMPGRELLCDKCPKSFKLEICLRRHMKRVHDNTRQYQCPLCKRQAKCKESLKHHMRLKHSDTYTFICYVCGSGFMREDYFKRHLTRHSGEREADTGKPQRRNIYTKRNENDPFFTCKYCHREYKTVHQLRIHLLNSHLNKTRFRCRFCDMTFKSAPVRLKHEKRHQDPQMFELTCQICWCRFPDKEKLELHSFKHVGSARRSCEICGEKFPSKFMLNHHKGEAHFNQEQLEQERNILLEDGLKDYRIENQTVWE